MSDIGHNSGAAGERIKSYVERVERLLEEKANIQADIKDIWAEAKSAGFDVKTLKKIVKLRAADPQELREQEETLEMYMNALGMLADLPLGQAAIEKRGQ